MNVMFEPNIIPSSKVNYITYVHAFQLALDHFRYLEKGMSSGKHYHYLIRVSIFGISLSQMRDSPHDEHSQFSPFTTMANENASH
jgi:hypothetical protein